ncbi:MAG: CBS domain-containing protein [Deltaproteobacteria bacterium]|nr:CBS domain-containing protein [Deltaproteobacteria bacterium]
MDVEQIMTAAVVTAQVTDSVRAALLKLEDQQIRHLPVVDGGRLAAMISDRDLREYRLPLMEELANPEYADSLLNVPLSELTGVPVQTIGPGEPVRQAIDLMVEYGVGALPVVTADGALVGVVSYVDVLRALRRVV